MTIKLVNQSSNRIVSFCSTSTYVVEFCFTFQPCELMIWSIMNTIKVSNAKVYTNSWSILNSTSRFN